MKSERPTPSRDEYRPHMPLQCSPRGISLAQRISNLDHITNERSFPCHDGLHHRFCVLEATKRLACGGRLSRRNKACQRIAASRTQPHTIAWLIGRGRRGVFEWLHSIKISRAWELRQTVYISSTWVVGGHSANALVTTQRRSASGRSELMQSI